MATSVYASAEETINACRACRLLLGPCTNELRDVLRHHVPPSTFPHVIVQKRSNLPRLTAPEMNLILPRGSSYTGNYNDMDISLLYILLRNICGITPHSNGWGNDPDPTNRSLSANIERIRIARNQCVHSSSPVLPNADFNTIWSTVRTAVVDFDSFLNNGNQYEREVDFWRHETMDPANDRYYIELRKQAKEDKATREIVHSLKRKVEETETGQSENQNKMMKIDEDEITTITKKPKADEKSNDTEWTTAIKEELKILKITFEFGPLQLNTYQYVFDGLKYIWRLSGLCTVLKEPDDSFLLFTDAEQDIEHLCLDVFSSIPTCKEISIKSLQEELLQPKPLVVVWKNCNILQKETTDLISKATTDIDSYLFFVSEENLQKEKLQSIGLRWHKPNILRKGEKSNKKFYDICNKIVHDKVREYNDVLSKKPKTRNNTHCLKLLRKYESSIKNNAKPSNLNKSVVDTVERVVKETSAKYHVIGYALYEKVLKLFAGSEIKSRSLALVKRVRSMLNDSFQGRIVAQLLQKPYIIPFSALQGGCELTTGSVSGTLGMFAKLSTGSKIDKIIAISSGHIATNGNEIMAALEGEHTRRIGHCIWPEIPMNTPLKGNIEDISVIILDDDIPQSIQYRMPKLKVKLPKVDLEALDNRKVFKFGAKTNKTYGSLKCAKKTKLLGADVMFIEPWHGETRFSNQGDSGSIVFTQLGHDLIAVGVVFGDDLTVYTTGESDEDNPEEFDNAHCIAVELSKAIELFELAEKGKIVLDKF